MIIKIDISPAELMEVPISDLSNLFSEAARCNLYGYHRVYMERRVADWVIANIPLPKIHATQIGHIKDRASEIEQVDNALYRMKIKIQRESKVTRTKNEWVVGHKCFIDGLRLDQTILLTENSEVDGKFYHEFLRVIANELNVGHIDFFRFHGGGTAIAEIYSDLVEYNKFVLAIADSDFYNSNEYKPGTVLLTKNKELKEEYASNKTNFIGLVVLTLGDKIENSIPVDLLKLISETPGKSSNSDLLNRIEQFENLALKLSPSIDLLDSVWLKFDLKQGVDGDSILENKKHVLLNWLKENGCDSTLLKGKKILGIKKYRLVEYFLQSDILVAFDRYVENKRLSELSMKWAEPLVWFLCGVEVDQT